MPCAERESVEALLVMSHPTPTAPARTREAVARYLPEASDASQFARGMRAYQRCEDGCRERAAGEPECRDSCARAVGGLEQEGMTMRPTCELAEEALKAAHEWRDARLAMTAMLKAEGQSTATTAHELNAADERIERARKALDAAIDDHLGGQLRDKIAEKDAR